MADSQDFREIQYAFAKHIRDPENNPAPTDAEDRRLAIYRELFFNNLRNLISQTFPVLKKLHSKEKWATFIRQFMVRHQAQTPYFLEVPKEFVDFLQNEKPEMTHVVLTGRNAKQELLDIADLATEMTLIKHPFRDGVKAQAGVEF